MAQFYQSYARAIANGEIYEANCYGKFVSILAWPAVLPLLISIENQEFSPIWPGMSVRLPDVAKPFYVIRFWNNTGGAVALQYAVSDGEIVDSRFAVAGILPVFIPGLAPANGYGWVPVSNVAPGTLVVPANAARRSVIIQNLPPPINAGNMMIGFDNLLTAVNYACLLQPGVPYVNTDYSGDIWVLSTVNLEAVAFGEV
jgi:hypothetical protein